MDGASLQCDIVQIAITPKFIYKGMITAASSRTAAYKITYDVANP